MKATTFHELRVQVELTEEEARRLMTAIGPTSTDGRVKKWKITQEQSEMFSKLYHSIEGVLQ